MIVVMISGPFRGENHWETESNIRRVEELALKVQTLGGVMPVMLHSMYRFFSGTAPSEFFKEAGLELLNRSDALLMEQSWVKCEYSLEELKACKAAGKPFFYDPERLEEWLVQKGIIPILKK